MNENTITITGNVATDPQHRLAGGVAITNFRVASTERRYDRQSAGWVDAATNWYTVSTFRGLADHAFESLRRGDRVLLTGRLRVNNWEAGEKKGTTVEIEADAIGHDLRWGVSRFEKDTRSASASGGQGDTWAAPGVTDDSATEWPVVKVPGEGPTDDAAPRPLELTDAETPF